MKVSKTFIVVIILFLIVLVVVELQMPRKYDWGYSFEHNDSQPFGCMVMDSILSASTAGRYSASGKTLPELKNEGSRENIMIVTDGLSLDSLEMASLDTLLMRGSNVLIATQAVNYLAGSFLRRYDIHVDNYYSSSSTEVKEKLKSAYHRMVTIIWTGKGNGGYEERFLVERGISDNIIRSYSYDDSYYGKEYEEDKDVDYKRKDIIMLGKDEDDYYDEDGPCAVMVADKRHKGRLIVVVNPLWFTNYGFTHDGSRTLAMRCISLLGDGPVIRLDTSLQDGKTYEESESQFRYLLKNRALRWALYLALLGIVLSMIFNSRRRQRVIPVVKKPENMAVNLIKHLGMLAYKKRDVNGLIESRYQMFEYELRKQLLVDIKDDKENACGTIARATGLSEEEVRSDLNDISHVKALIAMDQTIDVDTMKRVVGKMDKILSKIEIR